MPLKQNFSPLVDEVISVLKSAGIDLTSIYLVGGCVRDALLNHSSHDLDFVVTQNSLRTARLVADALGGAYFTMDEEFQVGRVVLESKRKVREVMDFTLMQGETLEDDLRNRDFTVNAIAVSLAELDKAIDPLGGMEDLIHKRLRACSPTALLEDPVRVLRAIRMAAAYGLVMTADTRPLVDPAVGKLGEVSAERLRDEFLKLLDAPKPANNLRILDRFGVIETLVPRASQMKGVQQSPPHIYDVWEHSLQTVKEMERVLGLLDKNYVHDNEFGGNLVSGMLSQKLGRFREPISQHIAVEVVPDRPYKPLLYLAAFCHDLTKPDHRRVVDSGEVRFDGHEDSGARVMADLANKMRLSNRESRLLVQVVGGHKEPWQMSKQDMPPTPREVYRFWNSNEEAGVDICLLAIADVLAIYGHTLMQDDLLPILDVTRTLLEAYWEHPEQVAPRNLIDGHDIMQALDLPPGPKIGQLMAAVREAQAVGEIETREQALSFAARKLADL